jgi:hypothetical protein
MGNPQHAVLGLVGREAMCEIAKFSDLPDGIRRDHFRPKGIGFHMRANGSCAPH